MSSSSLVITVVVALVVGAGLFLNRASAQTDPDGLVLTQLRKAGSNLGKRHDIEFFLYFPSEEAAGRVASKLRADGFGVTVSPAAGGGTGYTIYGAGSQRVGAPAKYVYAAFKCGKGQLRWLGHPSGEVKPTFNMLFVADMQQKKAASRRMLPAVERRR